jgi:hypothetical protein
MVPKPLSEAPLVVRRRYLVMVPRPLPRLLGVVQCAHRSLMGYQPACHIAIAILLALEKGTSRASYPECLSNTAFEAAWPPL